MEIHKKIFYLVLIIIWMIIVFMFSNQNGEESKKTSNSITKIIVQIITYNQDITEARRTEVMNDIDYIVRKCAHFSIYLLGGILIFNYINTFDLELKKKIVISILIGVLYASFDEFHQFFISERSGRIFDVCIDSLGVVVGVNMISLVKKWGNTYEYKSCRNDRYTCFKHK